MIEIYLYLVALDFTLDAIGHWSPSSKPYCLVADGYRRTHVLVWPRDRPLLRLEDPLNFSKFASSSRSLDSECRPEAPRTRRARDVQFCIPAKAAVSVSVPSLSIFLWARGLERT